VYDQHVQLLGLHQYPQGNVFQKSISILTHSILM